MGLTRHQAVWAAAYARAMERLCDLHYDIESRTIAYMIPDERDEKMARAYADQIAATVAD